VGEGIVRTEKVRNFESFESPLNRPSATFSEREKRNLKNAIA